MVSLSTQSRGTSSDIPALAAKKRFGRYKSESGKAVREADIRDETTRSLFRAWNSFRTRKWGITAKNPDAYVIGPEFGHSKSLELLEGIRVSNEDLDRFLVLLSELQYDILPLPLTGRTPAQLTINYVTITQLSIATGVFLSAIINSGEDREYLVRTEALSQAPHYLGHKNSKRVVLQGPTGRELGHRMLGGQIIVKGQAGDQAGAFMSGGTLTIEGGAESGLGSYMSGGTIICKGDAVSEVGASMEGGRIIIQGDVVRATVVAPYLGGFFKQQSPSPPTVGGGMKGGEIDVWGDFEISPNMIGGRIYHKGRLVLEK